MALSINVKQQNWARWESGVVSPNAETISTICKVHACSADWLLGIDPHNRGGGVTVHAGEGAAVAVGTNAKARAGSTPPMCQKCPHLKKLKQLEKLLAK